MYRRTILTLLSLIAAALLAHGSAAVADSAELDFSAWQHLPVFGRGRSMPLDTVARSTVEEICGRSSPKLSLAGSQPQGKPDAPAPKEARVMFPDGKPRKFGAAELLFSWLVEPERWECVPFMFAGYEQLRSELLDLPISDNDGRRLKYVSPRQVENAAALRMRLGEIGQRQRRAAQVGKTSRLSALERKAGELAEAYEQYRQLAFDPSLPVSSRVRFIDRLGTALQSWDQFGGELMQANPDSAPLQQLDAAVRQLRQQLHKNDATIAGVEPAVAAFHKATVAFEQQFGGHADQILEGSQGLTQQQMSKLRTNLKRLTRWSEDLARVTADGHLALYDNGTSLRLVPALSAAALEAGRDTTEDAQPWLSFEAVLFGSKDALDGYPLSQVDKVRNAFSRAAAVYVDRDNPDRAEQFAAEMDRFAAAVRELGKEIEPLRTQLPIRNKDETLIALTAYPPPGATDVEVRYNRSDPFLWSWIIALIATTCFSLSFGAIRKPMFWAAIAVSAAAQAMIVYGFALRVIITGWAPVTNMFETVVFVALVVAMLGVWFTLLPLIWPGLSAAWRSTAFPFLREATGLDDKQIELMSQERWNLFGWLMALPRLALMGMVFYLLSYADYGSGENLTVISLTPKADVGSSMPTLNSLLTWAVGMCVLAASMWYLPRAILTVATAVVTVPVTWVKQDTAGPLEETYARSLFAFVGAAVAFFTAMLGYFAPVFHSDISPLMPVLRNNFWLMMHVLSITASYGAAALAWGLGNIALGYYLIGRYRDPVDTLEAAGADQRAAPPRRHLARRRPPEQCATLAGFQYKAMQVAVLLLAAGTILGGLWADVSWGRFWGWDPKEVWALISLLVYMVILHGRYVRWFGNFWLSVCSVLGLTAVVYAWYGVNYLMPGGLHSYGSGTGGKREVLTVMAVNWIFVIAAAVRYNLETRRTA